MNLSRAWAISCRSAHPRDRHGRWSRGTRVTSPAEVTVAVSPRLHATLSIGLTVIVHVHTAKRARKQQGCTVGVGMCLNAIMSALQHKAGPQPHFLLADGQRTTEDGRTTSTNKGISGPQDGPVMTVYQRHSE